MAVGICDDDSCDDFAMHALEETVMKKRLWIGCMVLVLLLTQGACAASTPTPLPIVITREVQTEYPEKIQDLLNVAYREWTEVGGKELKRSNKYTLWLNEFDWGWCAGFVTWCTMEAGIPQVAFTDNVRGDVEGLVHLKEASVGKMITGYMRMNRVTNVPQKGFIVVYRQRGSGGAYHVGIVYDIVDLGEGRYRLTTIEGNMSNTVRMYVHDYDMNAKKAWDMKTIPPEDQTEEMSRMFSYKLQNETWYINCFLMTWIPEADMPILSGADVTVTPAPESVSP